jgi:Na+/melibiose symporter-like transporter
LLHDRLRDGKHLPFFIGAIVWSIFIQLSLIVKSDTNSRYDKMIRYISYFLIFVTITLVFYFSGDYDG